MVILSYAHVYVPDSTWRDQHIPTGKFGHGGQETVTQWTEGMDEIVSLLDKKKVPVIILQQIPRFKEDPLSCLVGPRGVYRPTSCNIEKKYGFNKTAWDIEKQMALKHPNLKLLDLSAHFCEQEICPVSINGQSLYAQGNHLDSAYAKGLSPLVNDFLVKGGYLSPGRAK